MDGYIALGSNLGDRGRNLAAGIDGLRRCGLEPRRFSAVWETEPVDTDDPRWFWNMAVMVPASGAPLDALDRLLAIERAAGRRRSGRNAPRTLDLDLLLWGDVEVDEPRLRIPHPRMWQRRFVLEPLAELEPGLRNPATGLEIGEECRRLAGGPVVRRLGSLAPRGTLLL